MNLLARVGLISCCEFEKCCLLLSQPNTIALSKKKKKVALGRKYVVSAEACRDSGQPQVIDVLLEWCVAYSRMSKSRICCRRGRDNLHFPHAPPLHSKMWQNWSDVNDNGVPLLCCSVVCIHVVVSQLQTLNRVQQECAVAARPQPTKHRGFETHLHVQPLLH